MSDKPEILSFYEWYKEAKKLNNDGFSANDFFEAGQQSRQSEIDELQKNFNNALKTIEIQQRFLDDADAAKERIDSLQKRIEDALKELEYIHFYKTQNSDNAIKILKGEETK